MLEKRQVRKKTPNEWHVFFKPVQQIQFYQVFMKIYHILSSINFLNKYSHKFLFIAFLGIHIPLIGMILYVILANSEQLGQEMMLLMVLIFTLLATGVTLYLLNHLLVPLILSKDALERYINSRTLPNLPISYKDEAGVLMQKVQTALMSMDEFVKSKEDMVTLISHDLRAPIVRTLGLAELLRHEKQSDDATEYIHLIQKENQSQLQLMNYILDQLKQEQLEISADKKEIVQLKGLITRSLSTLDSIIEEKKLEIVLRIPDSFQVRVEKILFTQVIQNLLHNACKFSFPGGKIMLESSLHNGLITIRIEDNGTGFNQSNVEKFFLRFTSHGQIGTAGENSTGIGLYLSRRIIERHSGSLRAHSLRPKTGANFQIVIPA